MSVSYLCPYVNFHGRANEALEFYRSVFGGTIHHGPSNQMRLDAEHVSIIATDGHPKYGPTAGDNMAIAAGGSDHEEMTRIFNGLAEGGRVKGPMNPIGYLEDRYGINWIVAAG